MQSLFNTLPQTDEKIHFEIKRLGKMGLTNEEISKALNIDKAYVYQILPEKMYTHDLYNDPRYNKDKIESFSPENAEQMARIGVTNPIRAKYFNKLRTNSQLNIGGKSAIKNKKKHNNKLSRRRHRYNKKNRKSMKRK